MRPVFLALALPALSLCSPGCGGQSSSANPRPNAERPGRPNCAAPGQLSTGDASCGAPGGSARSGMSRLHGRLAIA